MSGSLAGTLLAVVASYPARPAGAATGGPSCPTSPVVSAAPDAGWTGLFETYGTSQSGWSGGDGAYSTVLPDGRTAWFFSDTEITLRQMRPKTHLVHNAVVIEDPAGAFTQTLFDYRQVRKGSLPIAYINPTPFSKKIKFWPYASLVSGNELFVVLAREETRRGPYSSQWLGTDIAALSLPGLQVLSIVPLSTTTIRWGQWILAGGDGYTYIYGVAGTSAYVARSPSSAPLTDQAQWAYFDGGQWTADQAQAAPIASNVEGDYSVSQVGTSYVLVTMDAGDPFGGYIDLSFGCSPEGPFTTGEHVYQAPAVSVRRAKLLAYGAHVQPQLASISPGSTKLVVSYSVDTVVGAPILRFYKPKFVDITIGLS